MSAYPRLAQNADVSAIARLLQYLFEQEADFSPNQAIQEQGLLQILANPAVGEIYVIEQDGRIVASVSLLWTISTALGGKVALLEDFIVHPGYRGQGLGRRLLNYALDRARQSGCLRVQLLTDHDNLQAQAIYQQAGLEASSMLPMRIVF
jgi:GNAT superfamily N-acetyltransferase